jgi:hypothetical protein
MKLFRKLASSGNAGSLGVRMRLKRFEFFRGLMASVPRPVSILDVGGTERFWELMGWADDPDVRLHILNLEYVESSNPAVRTLVGDARDMPQFGDHEFDVVFSNSVIEHVGGLANQRRMADEVRRVGRRYFVQSPNRHFPMEPHFLIPFFQFFPYRMKVATVQYVKGVKDRSVAERRAAEIELLSKKTMKELFPGADLYVERVAGLAKSYVAYSGWR